MNVLQQIEVTRWEGPFSRSLQEQALYVLEHGQILYCPNLAFQLQDMEHRFLSSGWRSGRRKNISYDPATDRLGGASVSGPEARELAATIARYSRVTSKLVEALLPWHPHAPTQARSSFRPALIEEQIPRSYRKDDRLLHIDAFPSRPTRGTRILRVFTNVNPTGQNRTWRVGEPFEDMARKFLSKVSRPLPGAHFLLAAVHITKGIRTPYDHVMTQLHDLLKMDSSYQEMAPQVQLSFPPGSTWIMFSDQVLHAAMTGQYVFEQTFHLPISAQRWPELSPLRTLERLTGRQLSSVNSSVSDH